MPLRSCARCRYLFEVTKDVCPSCQRPVDAGDSALVADDSDEAKKTRKLPAIKPPKW